MLKRTWYFRSEAHQLDHRVAFKWRWEAAAADGRVERSESRFGTLAACVRDAQKSGFSGEVDPAAGTFGNEGYAITIREIRSIGPQGSR